MLLNRTPFPNAIVLNTVNKPKPSVPPMHHKLGLETRGIITRKRLLVEDMTAFAADIKQFLSVQPH